MLRISEGKKHDASMLGDSGLLHTAVCTFQRNILCANMGTLHTLNQALFRNVVLTPQMQAFNSSMSSVSNCVEWLFGDIVNNNFTNTG